MENPKWQLVNENSLSYLLPERIGRTTYISPVVLPMRAAPPVAYPARSPMPPKTISKIVLADALALVRYGLRQLIEAAFGSAQIVPAEDGQRALELIRAHQPCLAVLDEALPGLDGWAIAQAVRQERLAATLFLLTTARALQPCQRAPVLGVQGCVRKDSPIEEILAALRAVAAGDSYISPALCHMATNAIAHATAEWPPLTPTEERVLGLLAEYKTNPEIAAELGVSYRTVQKHCSNIRQKLDLHGPKSLLRFAASRREK